MDPAESRDRWGARRGAPKNCTTKMYAQLSLQELLRAVLVGA